MKKKNIIAKDLFTKKYKPRVVKPKKGKGSFKRKKTMIIVSHNSEILKNCDYIFNIESKKIDKNV